MDQAGIVRGVSAGDFFQCRSPQAELLWRHFVSMHLAFADFSDTGRTSNRNFVESVAAMNNQRAMQSEHAERFRKFFDKIRGIDTHDLAGGARGIRQRAEQVENRTQM